MLDFAGKREPIEALGVMIHLRQPGVSEGRYTLSFCPPVSAAAFRAGAGGLRNCEPYRWR
jgi:hypothetical protein